MNSQRALPNKSAIKFRKRQIRNRKIRRFSFLLIIALLVAGLVFAIAKAASIRIAHRRLEAALTAEIPDWVDVQLLKNHHARTGVKLSAVNNIVVHYVGNPGTTAQNNRDYFNTQSTEVCSHFVVGIDGEIIQCVPLSEKSAASNWRNSDTISIEVCHPDETGEFNEKTYQSVVKLVAWLCDTFGLTPDDVIRHYDITGKLCPIYYVNNPQAWAEFKKDVGKQLK